MIENKNEYTINPDVTWVCTMVEHYKYNSGENNTEETLRSKLDRKDTELLLHTPHHKSVPLENFDLKKGKIALLFGTE